MIEVKVVADSISYTTPDSDDNEVSPRLATLECTFHRFILPEVNTYRMWSRSAASSRAIPVSRKIEEVRSGPAMPSKFGSNQKGMISGDELQGADLQIAKEVWTASAFMAADYAEYLASLGVAKEITNRILEPYTWHTSVISSTDFSNCFRQRIPKEAGAQGEFQILASKMKEALDSSIPNKIQLGDWHLPYITEEEMASNDLEDLKKASVARVARTSYLSKSNSLQSDIDLYSRLLNADPPHLAPFEMIATAHQKNMSNKEILYNGNFDGWDQLRHEISIGGKS